MYILNSRTKIHHSLKPIYNIIFQEEAAGSNAMMKASGGLQLASIQHVLDALTPGAKKIFILLAK